MRLDEGELARRTLLRVGATRGRDRDAHERHGDRRDREDVQESPQCHVSERHFAEEPQGALL
jgi:hypothetical protein